MSRLSILAGAILVALASTAALADTYDEASRKIALPGWISMKAASFDALQGEPPVAAGLRAPAPSAGEPAYWLVKVRGPVRDADAAALAARGLEVVDFLQVNTFVVRGTAGALHAARALPHVLWTGAFHPAYKLDPVLGVRTFADGRDPSRHVLDADVWPGESVDDAARGLAAAGADVVQVWDDGQVRRIRCRVPRGHAGTLAHVRQVKFLEEVGELTMRNNATTWVCQTNVNNSRTIWDKGIHGEGQVAGHIDGPIDRNHCSFRDPANNTPGPAHRKLVAYRSGSGFGADSHGTHTAGTTAGDQSYINPGNFNGNGHAWAAKISHSNIDDITGSGTQTSNLAQYLTSAHNDGARAHTNSWGDDGTTQYTTWCVDIDAFSRANEDSLVVFAETNQSGAVRTPENAKNCLAVGLTDPPPSQGQKAWGGSGPTSDGRRKPEIFAPGSNTISSDNNTTCSFTGMGGTSMACPAVNGNALLARQYFTEGWYPTGTKVPGNALTPTAALVKAALMNATVDMSPSGYPSNSEGWGRLLLEDSLYFAGDARRNVVHDVRNASGLATGGLATHTFAVNGASQWVRVTMVFTDQPASLLASLTPINDLNLEVEAPGGTTYLGNVFNTAAGESQTGGTADALNNVENVLVKVPATGTWSVRVRGANVPQGPQGYALVITGDVAPGGGGQPPVADFSGAPTSGNAPLVVTFTDLSTSAPTSWSWDFGDAGTSTAQSPSHTYTAAGTYTVSLTATNAFGSDTETKVGYIVVSSAGQPPIAEFSGTPTAGAAPLSVSFTDLSANLPTSWSWTFGDGGTSTSQSPLHVYNAPGSYTVALTATNAFGSDTETKSAYVTVTGGGIPTEEIVSGAGPAAGNGPVVKTWSHASPPAQVTSWAAYGVAGYGVNVAAVDMVGGGTLEVVTGPGPAPTFGPQVRGFQPTGTAIAKVNYYAYGTLRYGAHPAGGDLDGDGHGEILTTPGPGAVFGPHVRGWNFDGGTLASISKVSFFAYGTLRYGARSAGGDTDADGFAEAITGAGAGAVFGPHVRGWNYDGVAVAPTFSFVPFGTGQYGAAVAAGDTDVDARVEVIAAHGPDPASDTEVRGYDQVPPITSQWAIVALAGVPGGAEPAAGDLDADGQDELVVASGWGAASASRIVGYEIVGTGGTAITGLDFDPYGQTYGAKVAVGDAGI